MRDIGFVSSRTGICAVIGNPLGHSLSPAIHNAAFDALDLDVVYLALQVEKAEQAVGFMRALEQFRGLSVTIPHKIAIMEHMDEIPELDRQIGAINTVVKEDGKLIGFGTDGPGALKALADAGVDPKGMRVLMIGAGGAARAIAFTLARQGRTDRIAILDIDPAVCDGLAGAVREATGAAVESAPSSPNEIVARVADSDLIVHCTPIGMHPKEDVTLVPAETLEPRHVVLDIVYNPLKTRLLREAEARGATVIPGVAMFVNQAVLQFERFSGRDAPVDVMRSVVLNALGS